MCTRCPQCQLQPRSVGLICLSLELLVKLSTFSREISVKDIDDQLMTSLTGSPPLEILVRTSGVKRLSDFMLWQVSNFYPFFLCYLSQCLH